MAKLISLVTPCRNAGHLLPDTIESIQNQRAVLDGRIRVQHIVIDGASSDNTSDVLAKAGGLDFLSEPDSGMYDALAKGLQRAQGEIVGYLNAGDILFPWAFDVLAEIFDRPGVDWVTGYASHINDRLEVTAAWKPPRYRREFVANGFYADSSYPQMIQQESTFWSQALNASIDWSALRGLKLAGDYFLWRHFAKSAELHSIMSQLGAFRIHVGQLSENQGAYRAEVTSLIRAATSREKLTAYWETRCNPAFRNFLWNFILPPSPARIFDFSHSEGKWLPK
jgi:glycosyltransferase involved in cell wall biosynthesis